MSTSASERSRISKKPGIPRPSGVRHSLGQLSVSKAIADVLGNKENAKDARRTPTGPTSSTKLATIKDVKESPKRKSPTTAAKVTQPNMSAKTGSSTPSPTSARKPSSLTVQSATVVKPRESLATSLPKYRPKLSVVPPKQPILTRKRRNSLVEAVEEESPVRETSRKLAERPISPLPRRSRVQSNASISSRLFDPKITLTTPQKSPAGLRTPIKAKGTLSSPASLRIRTLSTASSRLSVKLDSPTTRTEKRPRLISESRANNSLLASTSTIGPDMSSDSIDIADVSALLAVSPNVSPAKSIGPSSVRRITVRRPPAPSSGPTTPSRRSGTSIIPPRQNPSYLSPHPPKGTTSLRRPPPRGPGAAERGSIISWADFSNKKYHEEDLNLIAEIVPLKGVITPGSDDFHPRERIDSGWGMEAPHLFTGVSSSGPSIGQLMFPSVQESKQEQPPIGDAVSAKLLHVQLSAAEREVAELQAKVRAYEAQINAAGGSLIVADAVNELSVRTLQNAELEAKTAFLEESLYAVRQIVSEKDAELEQVMLEASRLERQCEMEKRAKEDGLQMAQKLVDDSAREVKRQVSVVLVGKVADATEAESQRWKRKVGYLGGIDDATREWRTVGSSALADLDTIRQMKATLRVLMTGVEAVKLNATDIS